MSEHSLPDDIRQWPTDPQQLLGVEEQVDVRSLRRAYTKLIRIFKPDSFPEHFRLVRNAYESLRPIAEWRERHQRQDVTGELPPEGVLIRRQEDSGESSGEQVLPDRPARIVLRSLDDELEDIWSSACEGELQLAYDRLKALQRQQPTASPIVVRLYWLLRVSPGLDPSRTPFEWLESAIAAGSQWQIQYLIQRELERCPEITLEPRIRELFSQTIDDQVLMSIVSARWSVAGRTRQSELILADLACLKPVALHNSALWSRLLIQAIQELAWIMDTDLEPLLAELSELPHFQMGIESDLDRLDLLQEIAREWRALTAEEGYSHPLVRLVPQLWRRSYHLSRQQLLEFAIHCVRSPEAYFSFFESMASRVPIIVSNLESSLLELSSRQDVEGDEVVDVVDSFFTWMQSRQYAMARQRLLSFCIQERLPMRVVISCLQNRLSNYPDGAEDLLHEMQRDLALNCLSAAHEAIWT